MAKDRTNEEFVRLNYGPKGVIKPSRIAPFTHRVQLCVDVDLTNYSAKGKDKRCRKKKYGREQHNANGFCGYGHAVFHDSPQLLPEWSINWIQLEELVEEEKGHALLRIS